MKRYFLFVLPVLLVLLSGGYRANAQKRTKLPRVTVHAPVKQHAKENQPKCISETSSNCNVLPLTTPYQEEMLLAEGITMAENTTDEIYAGSKGVIQQNRPTLMPEKVCKTTDKKISFAFTGDLLKSHTTLYKVKEVQKTAMELWVILLIVFYVLGLVFMVFSILALMVWNSFTLFVVFLILALLFSAAGSIMITLGQMGML